jgi:hypothetical protein
MKRPNSPHDAANPRPVSARPESGQPYKQAKSRENPYAAREAELKAHHDELRTDAVTGKRY